MKPMPSSDNAPVVRTDFSDESAWQAIRAAILAPVRVPGTTFAFGANVAFIDDVAYRDFDSAQLVTLFGDDPEHSFVVVVDRAAIVHPEHAVLVIDLLEGAGRAFRALPTAVQAIENNLSIANMDFEEFADAVDDDGVFRGFPGG